jgi:zinc and cadmium transporter
MSQIWIYTLISVFVVSLISLIGVLIIVLRQEQIKKILLFMVSFAAGAMLGDVFIHLLPELIEEDRFGLMTSFYILSGILIFFILEKILHWRHCHQTATQSHTHPLAMMNLVGDAIHNFFDGLLIAGSYLLSIPVGIATTVAVILHEIPQEMGDFGVLLHSGMKIKKALAFNFISALTAVFGALIVLGLGVSGHDITYKIIPITIGGFLYIANADLIPELHKDVVIKNSIIQLISFLVGVGIMFLLTLIPVH